MSEEKKVLTPEEIADEIKHLLPETVDFFDVDGNMVTHGSPTEWLIQLIREYGEQQYTLGSHGLFKEIAAKEI